MRDLNLKEAMTFKLAFLVTCGSFAGSLLRLLYIYVLRPRWHLRHIPRPKGGRGLRGHSKIMMKEAPGAVQSRWFRELGPVIQYDGYLSITRVCTMDKVALHHILVTEAYNFPKPGIVRYVLGSLTGEGVLVAEGATHQRQRKIMNPSFGAPHMKTIFPLFTEKALHLRDSLLQILANSTVSPTRIDMYAYASRATLDVISAAGFGHEAEAIDLGNESVLFQSFNRLFGALSARGPWDALVWLFPVLELIPRNSARVRATKHAHEVIRRLGTDLLQEKKMAVLGSSIEKKVASHLAGRDLLSSLVRANMAVDLSPQHKLSDAEVMAQISTILLAGNDTTANAISWALYGLCTKPETQSRLRQEILTFPSDMPTYDELNALPYLDAVMRETLRVYSPAPGTTRMASKDSVIPLSKPFVDSKGVIHHELFLAKNTFIYIPILASYLDTDVWGSDAADFRPERWIDTTPLPEGAREIPSVAFPTFLAGPRACIGFRFSLIELKTMLFSLIRSMEFKLAVPVEDIEAKAHTMMRPSVRSQPQESWQLPLLVKPVEAEKVL